MSSNLDTILAGSRSTPINWPNVIRGIVDNYIAHGADLIDAFQKDGIQNAIDAMNPSTSDDFRVVIRLVEGKFNAVVIEDYGTFGLTGKILSEDEMQTDLKERERWGRFESLAFRKNTHGKSLGARGQGKFLLLSMSSKLDFQNKHSVIDDEDPPIMYYDTLREDGTYRLGARVVKETDSPINHWEGENAKSKLIDFTSGKLVPLEHSGSRIIIPNPKLDLVNAIKGGDLALAIGVTWFPLLASNKVNISIDINGVEENVFPDKRLLQMPLEDTSEIIVWNGSQGSFRFSNKKRDVRIKMCSLDANHYSAASKDIHHLSIYRSGMKVMSISNPQLPKEIMDRIYGIVEVDTVLEKALQDVEDPTHYHFDFSKGITKKFKTYIETEIMVFAKEKLGYLGQSEDQKRKKRTKAERSALNIINELSRDFKLTGIGPAVTNIEINIASEKSDLQLKAHKLGFPLPSFRRVDYGEELKNIKCEIANNMETSVTGEVQISIQETRKKTHVIFQEEVIISANSSFKTPRFNLSVNSKDFRKIGKYFVKYRFSVADNKTNLNSPLTRKKPFWIEDDPLEKGIFKELVPVDFEGTNYADFTGKAELNTQRNWIFQYNTTHPAYLSYDNPEANLPDYVAEKAIPWLVYIDIIENDLEDRKIFHEDLSSGAFLEMIRAVGHVERNLYDL